MMSGTPNWVLLGRRSLVLGLTKDPQQTIYDRTVDVDLLHIVRTENLDSGTQVNGAT
jgi:hypothetical protein